MKKFLKFVLLFVFLLSGTSIVLHKRLLQEEVLDAENQPVIGANVTVKGTSIGVITGLQGEFSLNVPSAESTIVISFIGYATQEVQVGKNTVLNINSSE
jgi:TonB-dependent starch-binding outer membrane protein SusC